MFAASRTRLRRRGHRNRGEIDAERTKLQYDVNREIDDVVAEMHAMLPRQQAFSIGAVYARYSTEFQHSIADQVRGIFEFAVKNKIFISREHIFFDLAVRGCKERRPGLDRVRDLLARKAVQSLLVFTTNRLFRKNYKCMKFVEEEVVERGIRCVFVKTGIDTYESNRWRLPLQVHALVDEMASTQYAENIRAAHEGLFLKKQIVTNIPFGYMGKEVDGPPTKRNRPRRQIAIDPETSPWVHKVFQWFVMDRMKLVRILERLNDEKAPLTPMSNGAYWTHTALVYLLRNPCYRGLWAYGKGKNVWQSKQDYAKRVLRDCPLREAVFEDLRLVPDEIWLKAQELMDAHPQANAGRKPKNENAVKRPRILNGLLVCKEHDGCRLKVAGAYGQHMFCPECHNLPKASRPLYSYLNRALALNLICEAVVDRMRQDTELVEKIIASCQAASEQLQRDEDGSVENQRARVERIAGNIRFILQNPGETDDDREESSRRLKLLRGERAQIAVDIAKREAVQHQPKLVPNRDEVQDLIAKLHDVLLRAASGGDPEDAGAVRRLLEVVTSGRIELEQMGERRAQRGWLRGRFRLDLIRTVLSQDGVGIHVPASKPIEIVIDFRPRLVAEQYVTQVMELHEQGMLLTAIGNRLGIDRHVVTDAIKLWNERHGLPKPPDGRTRRAVLPQRNLQPINGEPLRAEVIRLYDEGVLICEIARRVDCDRGTVRNIVDEWRRREGLPRFDGRNRRKTLPVKNQPESHA